MLDGCWWIVVTGPRPIGFPPLRQRLDFCKMPSQNYVLNKLRVALFVGLLSSAAVWAWAESPTALPVDGQRFAAKLAAVDAN